MVGVASLDHPGLASGQDIHGSGPKARTSAWSMESSSM
jgi:hypothetical protein